MRAAAKGIKSGSSLLTKDCGGRSTLSSAKQGDQTVQVLYQKMGDRWFAFSLIGSEVFMGSISQSAIDHADLSKNAGLNSEAA